MKKNWRELLVKVDLSKLENSASDKILSLDETVVPFKWWEIIKEYANRDVFATNLGVDTKPLSWFYKNNHKNIHTLHELKNLQPNELDKKINFGDNLLVSYNDIVKMYNETPFEDRYIDNYDIYNIHDAKLFLVQQGFHSNAYDITVDRENKNFTFKMKVATDMFEDCYKSNSFDAFITKHLLLLTYVRGEDSIADFLSKISIEITNDNNELEKYKPTLIMVKGVLDIAHDMFEEDEDIPDDVFGLDIDEAINIFKSINHPMCESIANDLLSMKDNLSGYAGSKVRIKSLTVHGENFDEGILGGLHNNVIYILTDRDALINEDLILESLHFFAHTIKKLEEKNVRWVADITPIF